MRREGSHLVPVDAIAAEEIGEIAASTELMVSIRMRRHPKQHRLAWALAEKVAQACDFLHDREDAMDWLKIKARHVRFIQNPKTGEVAIVPKSIAFASLSQAAFNRFFNRLIYVVCTEVVPGMKEEDLRAEVLKMVGAS